MSIANTLSTDERQRLESCIDRIERNAGAMIEVANALREINEKRLYRETHATFREFVTARFPIGKSQAYQMIGWSRIVENVSTQVDEIPSIKAAAALGKLPDDEQPEAWQEAVDEADGSPTVAEVQEVVARRLWTCPNCGGQERDLEACKACHEPLAPTPRNHQRDFADTPPPARERKIRAQLTRACADLVVDITAVFGDDLRSDRETLKLACDIVRDELIGGLKRYAKGDGE